MEDFIQYASHQCYVAFASGALWSCNSEKNLEVFRTCSSSWGGLGEDAKAGAGLYSWTSLADAS